LEGWTSKPPEALPEGAAEGVRRVETKYVFIQTPIAGELPDHLQGEEVADDLSALGSRMLEAAAAAASGPWHPLPDGRGS
jgi:hypothetical protein